ncbi:unnamed protein product [Microthlaspi erraticum]|uniref:MADS-box domain-containing protein n=1 Tax=Microthlaspi erraticum TaxID=1685480 RepID=A0A6D2I5R0_9BRAS|nr:unnamed protein product [Microthlaspi erraticum]
MGHLELEKKKNEELKKIRENSKAPKNWWEDPIEGFDLAHAKEFKGNLENLKKVVTFEASKYFQSTMPHQNFYVGSSSNAPFRVDGGNFNPDLDQFNQRRMVDMSVLHNPNSVLPNHALPFGNSSHGNISERFVQEYNMNYMREYHQNQNLSFKKENISENDDHHDGHPPPGSRSDYC